MQKFKITKDIEQKVEVFYSTLFNDRDFKHPKDALKDLTKLRGYKSGWRKKYIEKIIDDFDEIVIAKRKTFTTWEKKFDNIRDYKLIKRKFWEQIVKTLRYSELKSKEYLELHRNIGIKTCMYCNSALAVNAEIEIIKKPRKKKGTIKKRKATFELDHYVAKSKYPFLSISFYNLIPSCSTCNKAKSINDINYYPFEETDNIGAFNFVLNKKSIQKYWKSKDINDLDFLFTGNGKMDVDAYNNMFHIQGIYNTQKDIIEELVHTKEAYTRTYKEGLVDMFKKKIFQDTAIIDRLIIGNYSKPEDIHKRPLSKFTQDIARDLKLIQ